MKDFATSSKTRKVSLFDVRFSGLDGEGYFSVEADDIPDAYFIVQGLLAERAPEMEDRIVSVSFAGNALVRSEDGK